MCDLIVQGAMIVVAQQIKIALADAIDEFVRVIAGRGYGRDQVTGFDIHHHGAGAFVAQSGLDVVL